MTELNRHGYKVLIITVFADFINIFWTKSEGDMCKVAQALHIFYYGEKQTGSRPCILPDFPGSLYKLIELVRPVFFYVIAHKLCFSLSKATKIFFF